MSNIRLFEPVFNDAFESMFKRFLSPSWFELDTNSLEIRLDVTEKNGSYFVNADLPGVKKEDINVTIDGNVIQIDAEVKRDFESKDSAGKILKSERYVGAVSRTFTVAQDVEDAKAVASYENGVLSLELPKKETSTSRHLQIH